MFVIVSGLVFDSNIGESAGAVLFTTFNERRYGRDIDQYSTFLISRLLKGNVGSSVGAHRV